MVFSMPYMPNVLGKYRHDYLAGDAGRWRTRWYPFILIGLGVTCEILLCVGGTSNGGNLWLIKVGDDYLGPFGHCTKSSPCKGGLATGPSRGFHQLLLALMVIAGIFAGLTFWIYFLARRSYKKMNEAATGGAWRRGASLNEMYHYHDRVKWSVVTSGLAFPFFAAITAMVIMSGAAPGQIDITKRALGEVASTSGVFKGAVGPGIVPAIFDTVILMWIFGQAIKGGFTTSSKAFDDEMMLRERQPPKEGY